jgi:hypothetical protein
MEKLISGVEISRVNVVDLLLITNIYLHLFNYILIYKEELKLNQLIVEINILLSFVKLHLELDQAHKV